MAVADEGKLYARQQLIRYWTCARHGRIFTSYVAQGYANDPRGTTSAPVAGHSQDCGEHIELGFGSASFYAHG